MSDEFIQKIQDVLERVRPAVISDGGDITFIEYKDGIVFVKLHGACQLCPISQFTLKLGILDALQQELPEIQDVIQVQE